MTAKRTRNLAFVTSRAVDVALVHWPAEQAELDRLRATRQPRLLIVEQGTPLVVTDALEDWLRAPIDETELEFRLANLQRRAVRSSTSVAIEDGVLRVGSRLVVLPPIEARLAAALLERKDGVVHRDVLCRRAWPGGVPPGRNVLDRHIARLRRSLDGTGVDIITVHRRGYLMRVPVPGSSTAS